MTVILWRRRRDWISRCPNFLSATLVTSPRKFDRFNSAASLHLSPTAFGGFPLAYRLGFKSLPQQNKKAVLCTTSLFWRRRRDLNPRAGCPTYTLSRGASSASWVFLQVLNQTYYMKFVFAFQLFLHRFSRGARISITRIFYIVN